LVVRCTTETCHTCFLFTSQRHQTRRFEVAVTVSGDRPSFLVGRNSAATSGNRVVKLCSRIRAVTWQLVTGAKMCHQRSCEIVKRSQVQFSACLPLTARTVLIWCQRAQRKVQRLARMNPSRTPRYKLNPLQLKPIILSHP
jgi:hypothetical protein